MNPIEPVLSPDQPSKGTPALTGARLARFEEYAAAFRTTFQRSDQLLRFRAYLRGLLEPSDRKNAEAIAAAASRVMMVASNLPQALHHFVSNSPWNVERLFMDVRRHAQPYRHDPDAVWVVHDGVFVKKGRHSVGVQRQFARSVGKKINCQVGVFVAQVGPAGYFPLAARLYLPAVWLREHATIAEDLLPTANREPATKSAIALQLLDELRTEGTAPVITGEDGYLSAADFRDGLAERSLVVSMAPDQAVTSALARFEWLRSVLGIDHFEGRTWAGWHHHVALVFAAYGFLCADGGIDQPPFRAPGLSPL